MSVAVLRTRDTKEDVMLIAPKDKEMILGRQCVLWKQTIELSNRFQEIQEWKKLVLTFHRALWDTGDPCRSIHRRPIALQSVQATGWVGTAFQGPAGRATKVSQLPGKALHEYCRYEDKMCTDSRVVLRSRPRCLSKYQWGFITRTDTQEQIALQIRMSAQADHEPRDFLSATAPQQKWSRLAKEREGDRNT